MRKCTRTDRCDKHLWCQVFASLLAEGLVENTGEEIDRTRRFTFLLLFGSGLDQHFFLCFGTEMTGAKKLRCSLCAVWINKNAPNVCTW